jgi:hypothetical protein
MTPVALNQRRFLETLEDVLRQGHPVRFRAMGWSMHPAIRDGETITVAPLGSCPIEVGDVLLYRLGGAAIAHRVVKMAFASGRLTKLVLRGDAADRCDAPIAVEQILGRVVGIGSAARPAGRGRFVSLWVRAAARMIRRAYAVRRIAAVIRTAVMWPVRTRSSGARP